MNAAACYSLKSYWSRYQFFLKCLNRYMEALINLIFISVGAEGGDISRYSTVVQYAIVSNRRGMAVMSLSGRTCTDLA